MAIGAPAIGTFTERTAETSSPVPYPATVGAGDILVLVGSHALAGSTGITNPAGWTQVFQASVTGNTTPPDTYVGIKYATGTEGGTSLSVTHTSAITAWQILAFPGVDQTTPQDVAATSVDQSTAALTTVIPAATVVTPGAALVAIGSQSLGTATATPPSGFTETGDRVSGSRDLEISYKLGQAAGTTGTQTITWTGSGKAIGVMLILRPAGQLFRPNAAVNRAAVVRASVY